MNEVIYKIRVNRPCRLFIDDEEMMILDENKLAKITLPEGEYLRKVVAIDNKAIYDKAEITLSGSSELNTITLDTTGLEEAKRNALPRDEFQVGDLMYKALEDGTGVAVAKYVDENVMEVVIPEEIVYGHYIYEVKGIGNWAFHGCSNLTSITIPSSVTEIGYEAFTNCHSLTSITIPNSVTSIGYAFWGCSGLTSIVVEKGNTVYDSRENCNAIIETNSNTLILGCQNTTIPKSVKVICRCAFGGCKSLTSFTIPNSVTSIGDQAFGGCSSMTSVTIPNSVTEIGGYAFYECSSLTSITIPNSVTEIGGRAFAGCSGLTSVTIPNSVTSIVGGAFSDCSSLTSVNIPNSVTSIGECAFGGCKSLTFITIPNSVKEIGLGAFVRCSGLTSIIVEQGNTVYDSRDNCNAIIETATNTLISGCQNTTIPNSITSIGEYAFGGCKSLTSFTIPNSVTNIGKAAFGYCSSLTSVSIPYSVTSIGEGEFRDCSSLTSVTIPKSVKVICRCAFDGCSGLTSVTVPSHTKIGPIAFPEHTQIIRK